jgi:hypothetical protein
MFTNKPPATGKIQRRRGTRKIQRGRESLNPPSAVGRERNSGTLDLLTRRCLPTAGPQNQFSVRLADGKRSHIPFIDLFRLILYTQSTDAIFN